MSHLGSRAARWLPILSWLPNYQRSWLRADVVGGVTVMALLVPEGMAYAELAGMPPQAAFYAAPIGLLLYAIFGSSRQLIVAVSSAIAVMSASIVGGLAEPFSPEFIALTAMLAVLTGLVAIVAGVLRLGRIAQFFSESVMVGFITGLALVIMIKQVPKLFGIEGGSGNVWHRIIDLLTHLSEAHLLTAFVGVTSLVLMLLIERRFHRIPAALVALVYGITIVTVFGLADRGVHIVGDIPAGLAPPQLPHMTAEHIVLLLGGAFALTLVAFAEAIGPARSFAATHKDRIDANHELVGLGAANVGAGLFQGFPIGASLSKSAANDAAGARSQLSGIIAAGLTALVALFLTPLFHNLPEATLAAIVLVAVSGMVKVKPMRRLYRVRRNDFWLAVVALVGVLTFHEVLVGLLLAVVVSLLALVYRASQARLSVMARQPGSLRFVDLQAHPEAHEIPGLAVLRADESLFFANAASIHDAVLNHVDRDASRVSTLLLDIGASYALDVPAADMLNELHEDLQTRGITLLLIRASESARHVLDAVGAAAEIGDQNFYPRVMDAVLDHLGELTSEEDVARVKVGIDRLLEVFDVLEVDADEATQTRLVEQREKLAKLARELDS